MEFGSAIAAGGRGSHEIPEGFEIIAQPLGGPDNREAKTWPGSNWDMTTASHCYALAVEAGSKPGRRALYVIEQHGGGCIVWRAFRAFSDRGELEAALLAMPERALYSLLLRTVQSMEAHGVARADAERMEWKQAIADKRVMKRKRGGNLKMWIDPARREGESLRDHHIRRVFAAPAGVNVRPLPGVNDLVTLEPE